MNTAATVDALLGLVGYARVRIARDADTIRSVLEEFGAVPHGERGVPTVLTSHCFRVRGRKVKLTIVDDGDAILTGPKAIVQELSRAISAHVGTR